MPVAVVYPTTHRVFAFSEMEHRDDFVIGSPEEVAELTGNKDLLGLQWPSHVLKKDRTIVFDKVLNYYSAPFAAFIAWQHSGISRSFSKLGDYLMRNRAEDFIEIANLGKPLEIRGTLYDTRIINISGYRGDSYWFYPLRV